MLVAPRCFSPHHGLNGSPQARLRPRRQVTPLVGDCTLMMTASAAKPSRSIQERCVGGLASSRSDTPFLDVNLPAYQNLS